MSNNNKGFFFEIDNQCLYCTGEHRHEGADKSTESTHFICNGCGIGMCDYCYRSDKPHDEHCFDYHESIEDEELYNHIAKSTGTDYGYMCYACLDRFSENLKATGDQNNI